MYIHGDEYRLFLNTTLGCRSRCSYCYLPHFNYKVNADDLLIKSSENIISGVESDYDFVPGRFGTIISLGCFSECWDEEVKQSTKELISYFLDLGNPVQFATKKEVEYEDIHDVTQFITWEGQLSIFVSSTSLTSWRSLERQTESPWKRFKTFELLQKAQNISAFLYIKPVVKSITFRDLDAYISILRKYSVSGVVVGGKFIVKNKSNETDIAPIGNGILVNSVELDERKRILIAFSKVVPTFTESIQAIESLRNA